MTPEGRGLVAFVMADAGSYCYECGTRISFRNRRTNGGAWCERCDGLCRNDAASEPSFGREAGLYAESLRGVSPAVAPWPDSSVAVTKTGANGALKKGE